MLEKFKNFWNKAWWSKAIIIFVILMIIGAFGSAGGSSDDTAKKEDKTVEKKEVKKETKKDSMVALNTPEKAGNFEYTFKSKSTAKTLGDPSLVGAEANDTFVVVEVSIKNIQKDAQIFSEGDLKLVCDGKEYNTSSDATTYFMTENSELFVGEINPDITKTGKVAFDVPANVANNPNAYIQVSNGLLNKPIKFSLK